MSQVRKLENIELILMATDEFQAKQFEKQFTGVENVRIHRGFFESLDKVDCLVSPANSFGLMDGGMDLVITNYFGNQLQERVQKVILKDYYGEQPIGTSFIVETKNEKIPYLSHTPTMRVPRLIHNTDNVYRAMKSMLIAVLKHGKANSVACPALGAGVGRLHPSIVAYQMKLAYEHLENVPEVIDWQYASILNYEIGVE